MGMYDTISFNCKECGTRVFAQSKGGECMLHDYDVSSVPINVAEDCNRHRIFCSKCNAEYSLGGLDDAPNRMPLEVYKISK